MLSMNIMIIFVIFVHFYCMEVRDIHVAWYCYHIEMHAWEWDVTLIV